MTSPALQKKRNKRKILMKIINTGHTNRFRSKDYTYVAGNPFLRSGCICAVSKPFKGVPKTQIKHFSLKFQQ